MSMKGRFSSLAIVALLALSSLALIPIAVQTVHAQPGTPTGCSTADAGITLDATPFVATSGTPITYTIEIELKVQSDCNVVAGTITLTTPDGVVHDLAAGVSITRATTSVNVTDATCTATTLGTGVSESNCEFTATGLYSASRSDAVTDPTCSLYGLPAKCALPAADSFAGTAETSPSTQAVTATSSVDSIWSTFPMTDTAPTISPEVGSYVAGQSITLAVTWGYVPTHLYTVSLYASPVDSCLGPFTSEELVEPVSSGSNPALDQLGLVPTYFTFYAPNSNLYACVSVTDTWVTPPTTLWSGVGSYFLAPPLTSYNTNEQGAVSIDLNQSVQLTDYPSGGDAPYTYAWYGSGNSTCPTPNVPPFHFTGIPEGTSSSFTTAPITATGTYHFSVVVTDSSIGTSPTTGQNTICETVAVTVNPALTGTFAIDGLTGKISGQTGSPALKAVVNFTGGTGPWYAVTIYSGNDYACSGDTTVVSTLNDITGTEAIFSLPEPSTPSSTTYYCAVLTDSSVGIPTTSTVIGPIQVNISPALSTPTLSIGTLTGSTSYDYGYSAPTVYATVTWAGGTAPYYVLLTSGSSSSCASLDNVPVATKMVSGGTPYTLGTSPNTLEDTYAGSGFMVYKTTGSTVTLSFTAPASTAYYCATVFDSSSPQSPAYTAAGAEFTVESLFAVNAPALSTAAVEVLSPLYEGNTIKATVTWSGGSGPYDAALYQGSYVSASGACTPTSPPTLVPATPGSNPQTGLTGTSATFSFLAPNSKGTYCYYAAVTDSSASTVTSLNPPSDTLGFASLVVSPSFTVPTTVLHATQNPAWLPETDSGQTESVTATVTWSGGNEPYTASLYEGGSGTCASDTTQVGSTQTGIVVPNQPLTTPPTYSAVFTFTSPATTSYYCGKVTDSSVPVSTGATVNGAMWTVSPPPTVSLPASYAIAAGSATSVTATVVTPGSAPDYLQWFTGSTCAAADAATGAPPASTVTYNTGLIATATTYSVQITDSSHGTPAASACASITIGVNSGPAGVAGDPKTGMVYVATPYSASSSSGDSITVIDSRTNTATKTIRLFVSSSLLGSAQPPSPDALPGATQAPVDPWGVAVDSVNNIVYVTGEVASPTVTTPTVTGTTATGTTSTVMVISTDSVAVAPGALVGMYLEYTSGPASGQYELISANTNATITTAKPFSPAPTSTGGDTFAVSTGWTGLPAPWTPFGVVIAVNGATDEEVACYIVGSAPEGVAIDNVLNQIYIANSGDNTVSVYQATSSGIGETQAAGSPILVGAVPESIAVDQTTYSVFVTDSGGNTLTVIQPNTSVYPITFTATAVNVGSEPVGVAVYASTDTVYVANYGSGTVSVLNGFTYATIATINVGGNPTGIDIDTVAATAYVANAATDTLSVINLTNNTPMTSTISVGSSPFGVAVLFNPSNTAYPLLAYVTNQGSNTVTVIDLATGQAIATIVVPMGSG